MIYCDFEYNERSVLLGCFLDTATGRRDQFDFRQRGEEDRFADYLNDRRGETWVSYSSMAEMSSILRVGGSLGGMRWIDLMAEAAMISGTHPAFLLKRPKLLSHLKLFGVREINPADEARKSEMRDLILSDKDFTPDEWDSIVSYCWTDVDPLPDLHRVVRLIHREMKTEYTDNQAVQRGEYLKASAVLEHRSKGLPVDIEFLTRIHDHKDDVRNALAVRCNEYYGFPIYAYNHVRKSYSFNFAGLHAYLASLPFGIAWEKTESGRLRLDEDYIDDLVKANPELKEFQRCRMTMNQLSRNDLLNLVHDDHFISPASVPFYTVTGRNQPMVKGGFILNMAPWLRHVIRPEPNHVLIAADWSKQEIAIALAFSKDEALREAYLSGDIYLALAKMAGAVPPEGTKETHGLQRQAYKAVQLGLGYGMGKPTLGRALYNDLNEGATTLRITREEAEKQAVSIYDWHKRTFVDYWKYLNTAAKNACREGWTSSRDRWLYFADHDTRFTRVMNFPMQSNGAVCLREAIKTLANKTDLNVVCSLHDAIYIYCHEDDAAEHTAILRRVMNEAVTKVIGSGVEVDVDVNVYTHETGYYDKRGSATLKVVRDLISHIEEHGAPPVPEKPVRKRKKPPIDQDFFAVAA